MDVLADIVAALDLRASLYFRARFGAPFSVSVPEDRARVRFHVAEEGTTLVHVPSGDSVWLEPGDLVLVPHGGEHVLASAANVRPTPLARVEQTAREAVDGTLCHGGEGPESQLLCGHFEFDEHIVHPVVRGLPALVHLRGESGAGFTWMAPLVELIERERWEAEPGVDAITLRLSEILFIQLLRAARAQDPAAGGAALAALADDHLRRVLESVHADPGEGWTLEKLAARAGLSRSVLAERFRERLGVSPMRYVADWRVQRARHLLTDRNLSVGEVARRVGYASEAAFSRVFRESVGEAPGRYRRALN